MEKRVLYTFINPPDQSINVLFEGLFEHAKITVLTPHIMRFYYIPETYDEPIDFTTLYQLIKTDFDAKMSLLDMSESNQTYIDIDCIVEHLQTLPYRSYEFTDFIVALQHKNPEILTPLKTRIIKQLGQELIDTLLAFADANMNASIAAKNLYLHRNSLNYRLDKITEITGLDIRQFKALSLLYYWFKT